jgi:hypothetical protein
MHMVALGKRQLIERQSASPTIFAHISRQLNSVPITQVRRIAILVTGEAPKPPHPREHERKQFLVKKEIWTQIQSGVECRSGGMHL